MQGGDERYRVLAELTSDYLFEMAVAPDGRREVRWLDGAVAELTGYEPAELMAIGTLGPLVHPADRAAYDAHIARLLRGEPSVYEVRFRRKDGALRWQRGRVRPEPDPTAPGMTRWLGSVQDVTERRRAEEELRRLSGRLLQGQDEERRRLARELHEGTAQVLAALSLLLARLERQAGLEDGAAKTLLDESRALADQALREVRTLSYLLYPPLLAQAGLASAARWYAEGFAGRSGIAVDVRGVRDVGRLPEEVEATLYRVLQECLTNVHRHSRSASARVALRRTANWAALRVRDHGVGLAASMTGATDSVTLGVGIAGMRERLRQLGGQLTVRSCPGGAAVTALAPLRDAAADDAETTDESPTRDGAP